jgi:hypothetical protein
MGPKLQAFMGLNVAPRFGACRKRHSVAKRGRTNLSLGETQMKFSFTKFGALIALILAGSALSAHAFDRDDHGFNRGPGFNPGFNRGPGFDRDDRGFNRGPGFDRDDRGFNRGPGFGPGFRGPGWGPGFAPGYNPGNGYGPVFVPGPGYIGGPQYNQGYVYTCFAIGNAGTPFYATGFDPNQTQAQAYGFCASSGQCCQPTGCR